MNCPYCNNQNPDGVAICSSCGAPLNQPMQEAQNYQEAQSAQYPQNQFNETQPTQFIQQNTQVYEQPGYGQGGYEQQPGYGQSGYEQPGYEQQNYANQQYYAQQDYVNQPYANQPYTIQQEYPQQQEYFTPESPSSGFVTDYVVKGKPMSRGTKISLIIIAIAIVVLGIGYAVIQQNIYSPQATIQRYVKYLQEGNFDEASNMTDWSSSKIPANRKVLLTNAIGKSATSRITDVNVVSGPYNSFKVSYKIAGQRDSMNLVLVPGGKQWLFFDSYKVQYPSVGKISLSIPNQVKKIKVNNSEINLDDFKKTPDGAKDGYSSDYTYSDDGVTTSYLMPAYPGSYHIESIKDSQLWTTGTSNVLVNEIGVSTPASLKLEATDALRDELTKAIKKHIDKCVSSTDTDVPENCSFARLYTYYDYQYDGIQRSTSGVPDLDEVDMDSGTFRSNEINVDISYRYKSNYFDDSDWESDSTQNSGYVYGKFSIDGKKLTIDFTDD